MRSSRCFVALVALLGFAVGCSSNDSSEEQGTPEEETQIVAPGKEDNFLSATAQEYMVEGISTVTIESSLAGATDEQKLARVHELIPLKHIVIGWFLNAYIVEKNKDDANAEYGGFKGLTKNGAYEELGIEALDDTTYQFTFRQEFGGKLDLLEKLPTTMGTDGKRYFDLTIGKISNTDMAKLETNAEWYRSAPWSSFDPSKVDASRLEKVTMAVWPEPRSIDAWFDTERLLDDGKLTMGIHFGWDYHNEYHVVHSRDVYNHLVGTEKFRSPVASYDEYKRTSGPLTKTIQANGKSVQVEISLFWGKVGTDTDPDTDAGGRQLEADMRDSFRDRDVIVFSGHSGPFYGFALANWRKTDEGDLDDSEVPGLDMPADKYQVVIAEGCDTYSLGQSFRMNPNKADAKNIDIVTTTSFSNASTAAAVKDSIKAIVGTNSSGEHQPVTFLSYLRDMDNNSYWFSTMYGVHGIDDNPHRHPYAVAENLCKPCSANAECGGVGNKCSRLNTNEKFCTFECTDDDGCPQGYQCLPTASGTTMSSMQCAPLNLTCTAPPPEPTGPAAILNEVFASPKADGGDANGDGVMHAVHDEFVEIVNVTNKAVDLTGWKVADSYMTRFAFPSGSVVQPGQAVLVFGGGVQSAFTSFGNVAVFVTANQLGLNNTGDRVTLTDKTGNVVDEMSYGSEGGGGVSLVRATDGDPSASWGLHSLRKHSAGLRSDGSPF
jgi:hypothetical protein